MVSKLSAWVEKNRYTVIFLMSMAILVLAMYNFFTIGQLERDEIQRDQAVLCEALTTNREVILAILRFSGTDNPNRETRQYSERREAIIEYAEEQLAVPPECSTTIPSVSLSE